MRQKEEALHQKEEALHQKEDERRQKEMLISALREKGLGDAEIQALLSGTK